MENKTLNDLINDQMNSNDTNHQEEINQNELTNEIEKSVNVLYKRFISNKETVGLFVCPHEGCGKKYQTEESLNRHLNRHSSVKQHICQYCGKAFLRKSECEIHQRIHTGVKPYQCVLCEKRFARATDLKIHMVYHSDDKPFSCPFPGCKLRFKRKSDAKKHLRIHVKKTQGNISNLMRSHQSAFAFIPKSKVVIIDENVLLYLGD